MQKPIQQLELGNIDVSETDRFKDVVFCVYSEKSGLSYYLQLAHTTNIGFNYEIYKAKLSQAGELSYLGQKYNKGDRLKGDYLNKNLIPTTLQISIILLHIRIAALSMSRNPQSLSTGSRPTRKLFLQILKIRTAPATM
ncbi:MAG: hypothetical protein ACLU6Y_16115 [Ruminococcus sp.]